MPSPKRYESHTLSNAPIVLLYLSILFIACFFGFFAFCGDALALLYFCPQMSTAACAEAEVYMWVGQLADVHKLASSSAVAPTPATAAAARSARKKSRDGFFDGGSSASEPEDTKEAPPPLPSDASLPPPLPPWPPPPSGPVGVPRADGAPFATEGLMSLFGTTTTSTAAAESPSSSTEIPVLANATTEASTPLKGPLSSEQPQLSGSAALASASWVVAYFADRVAVQKEALYNAEDAVTDARSLYEKAFRRRKGTNADRRSSAATATSSSGSSNGTPTSGGGGPGSTTGGTAVDWLSSVGSTIAGVFNGTEEVASLARALAEASSNLKVAKVRVQVCLYHAMNEP